MEKQSHDNTEIAQEDSRALKDKLTAERSQLVARLRILEELSAKWEESNKFFKEIEEVSNQIQELDTQLKAA